MMLSSSSFHVCFQGLREAIKNDDVAAVKKLLREVLDVKLPEQSCLSFFPYILLWFPNRKL